MGALEGYTAAMRRRRAKIAAMEAEVERLRGLLRRWMDRTFASSEVGGNLYIETQAALDAAGTHRGEQP